MASSRRADRSKNRSRDQAQRPADVPVEDRDDGEEMTARVRPPLPTLVADPDEAFTGQEIRRLTARVTAARADAGPGEIFTDVGYVIMSIAISIGFVIGAAEALRDTLLEAPAAQGTPILTAAAIQWLGTAALAAFLVGLAVRLGPLGVSGAGVRWWLTMPVDRRGLLTPSYYRNLVLWVLVGAVGFPIIALVSGVTESSVARSALLGAACGGLIVAVAGLVQPHPRVAAALIRASDVAVAVVPLVGVALVLSGRSSLQEVLLPTVVVGVLAALALGLAVWWASRLEILDARVLRARSAVADQANGAVLSFDTRELGRALNRSTRPSRRRRSSSFSLVRGPMSAVIGADLTLLGRSPGALAQVVGLAALLVIAQQVPVLSEGFGLFVLLVVVGFRSAQLGAEGARTAEMAPILDALVPMSARRTRLARTVVPTGAALVCLLVGGIQLVASTGDPSWFLLLAVCAVVFAAAAVRGAYRKPPNWSAPLIATPGGALPTGAASMIAKGPDVAVLGAIPLGIALVVGTPAPGLVVFQVGAAWIALLVASHVRAVGAKPLMG